MLNDEWRKCNEIWNSLLGFGALYAVWVLVVHPLVPPENLGLTCLREGKTRTALEGRAKELDFPLGNLYTSLSKGASEDDILIYGWPHKRNIVIPESVLEKCNTEDVVALVAAEMGSWKHNPFQQVGTQFLVSLDVFLVERSRTDELLKKYGMLLIPIWSFHRNWAYVVQDFGFDKRYPIPGRRNGGLLTRPHPFFVVVLILGGALDPIFRVGTIIMNAISRELGDRAGTYPNERC